METQHTGYFCRLVEGTKLETIKAVLLSNAELFSEAVLLTRMSKGLRVCLEALVRSRDAFLIITLRIQFKEPCEREGKRKNTIWLPRHFLRKPSRVFQPAEVPTGRSTKYHLILIPLNFNAWKCDLGLSGAGRVTLGRMNIQTVACRATPSGVSLESQRFVRFLSSRCACLNKAIRPPWKWEKFAV